jgi:hypothetical protein
MKKQDEEGTDTRDLLSTLENISTLRAVARISFNGEF